MDVGIDMLSRRSAINERQQVGRLRWKQTSSRVIPYRRAFSERNSATCR